MRPQPTIDKQGRTIREQAKRSHSSIRIIYLSVLILYKFINPRYCSPCCALRPPQPTHFTPHNTLANPNLALHPISQTPKSAKRLLYDHGNPAKSTQCKSLRLQRGATRDVSSFLALSFTPKFSPQRAHLKTAAALPTSPFPYPYKKIQTECCCTLTLQYSATPPSP